MDKSDLTQSNGSIRLSPEASALLLSLCESRKIIDAQLTALVLGAGLVGEYRWTNNDGLVTLEHVTVPQFKDES